MTHTRDLWYRLYDTFADETDIKHKYSSIADYVGATFGNGDGKRIMKTDPDKSEFDYDQWKANQSSLSN